MRSGNPAFSESTLLDLASGQVVSAAGADAGTMTVNGTVNKTGLLLLLVVITGAYSWSQAFGPTGEINPAINVYLWGGMLAGFGLALAGKVHYCWLLALSAVLFMLWPARRNTAVAVDPG